MSLTDDDDVCVALTVADYLKNNLLTKEQCLALKNSDVDVIVDSTEHINCNTLPSIIQPKVNIEPRVTAPNDSNYELNRKLDYMYQQNMVK